MSWIDSLKAKILGPAQLIIGVVVTLGSLAGHALGDTLVVSNRQDRTVTFFDTQSKEPLVTIETEAGMHEFAVSPTGNVVVGSCYGSGPGHRVPDHRLIAIDVKRLEAKTIDLGDNPRPNDLTFLDDGQRLLVTSERKKQLLEVDVSKGEVLRKIPLGIRGGHMLAVSPNKKFAIVPCVANGDVVQVELGGEANSPTQFARAKLDAGAEGIDVSPNGRQVWIACNRNDKIYVLATASLKRLREIDQDGYPFRLRFARQGRIVLVSCPMKNQMAVYDAASAERIGMIDFEGQPTGIAVSNDGDHAFVVLSQKKQIAEVDLRTFKVVHRYPTGNDPDAVAITEVTPTEAAVERVKIGDENRSATNEEFMVRSGDAEIVCTLTKPEGEGPFPTVIVIGHGAGMTRDGVKFEVDGYSSLGFATVTFDRRGYGKSTGKVGGPFSKTASDVKAIIQSVIDHRSIDSERLGISCRSRGAWVGPMVASTDANVRFVVALAPPLRTVSQTLTQARLVQVENLIETREKRMLARDAMLAMADFARKKISFEDYTQFRNRVMEFPWGNRLGLPPNADHPVWNWLAENADFDPVSYWQFVRQPVCAVFAEMDQDVPLQPHKLLIESALKDAGNASFNTHVVANADHEFNPIVTESSNPLPSDEVWRIVGQWFTEQHLVTHGNTKSGSIPFVEFELPTGIYYSDSRGKLAMADTWSPSKFHYPVSPSQNSGYRVGNDLKFPFSIDPSDRQDAPIDSGSRLASKSEKDRRISYTDPDTANETKGGSMAKKKDAAAVTLKSPVQKRSKATLKRIFDATKQLLSEKRFADISIQEIAAAAECGVGTVYGRFENKTALLSYLEQEVVDDIVQSQKDFLSSRDWSDVEFELRIDNLLENMFASYKRNGVVLRELLSRVHQKTGGVAEPVRRAISSVFKRDVDFLVVPFSDAPTSEVRSVVGLALMSAILTIQNRLLQKETSPNKVAFGESFLRQHLSRMAIAYVRSEYPVQT